jgi:hypothetical protein
MTDEDYEKQQDRWALWHIVSIAVLALIGLTEIL